MHVLIRRYIAALLNCRPVFFLIFLFAILSSAHATDMNPVTEVINNIYLQRGREQISAFTVETATVGRSLQEGLSRSAPIPDNYGMLFVLDRAGEQFFWMKGMRFGLDILFFDKDRRLIEILPDLRPCRDCAKYKTSANTAYALEVNAGMADLLGLKTGDTLEFAKE